MPTLPPDTRATGTGDPAGDMNSVVDVLQILTGASPGGTVLTGSGSSWNAGYWDPRAFGAVGDGVTDDTAAINACITATPALGGIVNLAAAPVSYAISSPIILKQGCSFIGSWVNAPSATSHLDVTTLASFSGVAAMGDAGALSTGPVNTVGAGSNGGTLSAIASWGTPSAGVLATGSAVVTGAGGFPTAGQLSVATAGGTGLVAYTGVSGSSFTGCTYVSGTGTTVATGGTITGASPTSSYPISVMGVSIDLTLCTGTTTDAFRLMTYGAWVHFCMTKKAPACGLRFTDANAGGFAITNSAVENRVTNCSFTKSGLSGILVENHTAALTDGYCVNNIVQGRSVATGDASDSTGPAFDFEYCSDWQIRGNHAYACAQDGFVIKNGFGTFFDGNDVDVFGTAGTASTTFHGVYLANQLAGPATLITSCDVQNDDSHGAASTVYEYYHANGTTGQTGYVTMVGNCARQATSGSATSRVRGFIGSGGTLNITEVGTTVVGATTSPTLSAVNSLSGTVNLLHPGSTAVNSGATSVPVGTSSTYGTITDLLNPLFSGASMVISGIQIVWGGTFAADTVNALFTATFDDGTTATFTSANATATSTVNTQGAQFSNFCKNGRQMVRLQGQARTGNASTTVTCTVSAFGSAA